MFRSRMILYVRSSPCTFWLWDLLFILRVQPGLGRRFTFVQLKGSPKSASNSLSTVYLYNAFGCFRTLGINQNLDWEGFHFPASPSSIRCPRTFTWKIAPVFIYSSYPMWKGTLDLVFHWVPQMFKHINHEKFIEIP